MSLLTGNQLRAARALVGVDQRQVAEAADIAINTVRSMEAAGAGPVKATTWTLRRVQEALEAMGVEFIEGKQPGVRLVRAKS